MLSQVQYISQGNTAEEQLKNIQSVLDKGYDWIQLRFKKQTEDVLIPVAEKVKMLCDQYKAIFIMNDHVSIAQSVDASGVHLGLEDASIANARSILGSNKIIGGTANTLSHVMQRIAEGCDYIGLGPFRFTTTKEKLSPVLGLEGYQTIIENLYQQGKNIPIYAIGGIEQDDIQSLMQIGLHGIAISGLLTKTDSPSKQILLEHAQNIPSI